MPKVDQRELVSGVLLAVFGVSFSGYAVANYDLGSLTYMQAGMLPAAVGVVLAVVGVCIALSAFAKSGTIEVPPLRPFFGVIGGLAGFALTVDRLGLVVAVCVLTLISALADRTLKLRQAAILAAVLAVTAVVIFVFALGMRFKVFPW